MNTIKHFGLLILLSLSTLGAERPNIVVVLADDFGYGDVSAFGGTVPTPHLDRMAREGARFTQCYVASPICSPSRAGIITGQFPARWRITSFLQTRKGNAGCEQADFLNTNAPSLPRTLKAAGYATAHIGKWHLGGGRDVTSAPKFAAYGYDVGLGTYESPEPHPDITGTNWIWSAHDKVKRHARTRWMVDRTLDFLRDRKGKPCFINLWLDDTHTPFVPSQQQLIATAVKTENTQQQEYRAVLVEMDKQIGRLLDGLREIGATNTLVLFLGDNGALPTFGHRNGTLRASKLSLYEGGIRVPFIAHWPGQINPGGVNDTSVVAAVDFFPTICALTGTAPPGDVKFDGEDISNALCGRGFSRTKPLFWEYGRNTNWFKFPAAAGDRSPNIAVRDGRWKLLVNNDGSNAELYDVHADVSESQNLATKEPETAGRLMDKALTWRKNLPGGRPNIVVFIADDHGALDSEIHGNNDVRTPNMRRLAADAMTFTQAFVASPSCAPSRAALLTGLMPARNGAEANHSRPRSEIKKLPAYLKELGYEIVAFGKVSHYKHTKDYDFDYFAHDAFHEHAAIPAALKWLHERKSDKPLCIFVGSNWPHVPWPEKSEGNGDITLPPTQVPTTETRHARALYYSAVTRMDEELGQVYDTARETLGTNILFIHTSDHGAQFPFGKWNCYDAGTRVSLLVGWPGVVRPGTRTDAMVSWVDILPTLIEAAGGSAPSNLDGRSFLGVLRGESSSHRDRIFTTHSGDGNMNVYPIRSVRTADWKFILNLHPEFSFHTHIDLAPRDDKPGYWGGYWSSWTNASNAQAATIVKRYHQRPAAELYDLRNDPFETNNLAMDPRHASRARELRADLETWMRQQGDKQNVFGKPRPVVP